ncbi:MAG TPA: DUF3013 family protein [Cytophagaceae bacterium]|jgi:hypothetical protein|nr:DUF3013 family protein [Cytophagaceae bacterium]
MKKICSFIAISVLVVVSTTISRAVTESKVPTCIKSTFYTNFPYAEKIHWEKKKNGIYLAQFLISENKATAMFNSKGVLVESDIVLFNDDVPLFVLQEIKKEKDVHVVHFAKSVDINHTEHYLLTLRKGKEGFEVVFDQNWKVLEIYQRKDI